MGDFIVGAGEKLLTAEVAEKIREGRGEEQLRFFLERDSCIHIDFGNLCYYVV
jgi:hypothetical protein